MKPQVANSHYRTFCLRIQPVLGAPIRLTQHPRDLLMSNGAIYLSASGYQFSGVQHTSSGSGSVVDIEGIAGYAGVDRSVVASGSLDGARCYLFAVDWRNPIEDYEEITCSIFGKVTLQDGRYKVEETSLVDLLNQSVGVTVQPLCRNTLGDGACRKSIAYVSGTVTSVSTPYVFIDSSRTEPDDWFGQGLVRFTSGLNAGLAPHDIKSFAVGGVIEIFEPFYYPVSPGDQIELLVGCRKRWVDDCSNKHGNGVNFGAFPSVPTNSVYTQVGRKTFES